MSTWKEAIAMTLPSEAHMIQAYLESEGIVTVLKDELTVQVQNFYSSAVGGVKVMVREEDFEEACKALIAGGYLKPEPQRKVEIIWLDQKVNKKECPFCRSENIGKKKQSDVIMLVIFLILGMIFPVFRRTNYCFDCNKEWVYKKK